MILKILKSRAIALALAAAIITFSAGALAYDAGDVAVIEDTEGKIIPLNEGGMCPNMLFGNGLCPNEAAKAFYKDRGDNYDVLIFFTNYPLNMILNNKMGFPVQSPYKGIGLDGNGPSPFNPSQFGSAGRLLQCVKMGGLNDMPNDPYGIYNAPFIAGIELVAHEIGHHWLAWITIDLGDGKGKLDVLRGYSDTSANGHWSSWFNTQMDADAGDASGGSVMYGGMITDLGNNAYKDIAGKRKYTPLDQYLMGLRKAADVPAMWYVDVDGSGHGNPAMPWSPGSVTELTGKRVDFTIQDVIRANGPRVPELSKCHLKVAFALVYPTALPPTDADIAKVNAYRMALEAWWQPGTDYLGSVDTRLDGCGQGTKNCPGEKSPQCGAPPDGDADSFSEAADETEQSEPEPYCTPGAKSCENGRLLQCDEAGQNIFIAEDCDLNGGICQYSQCVYASDGDDETEDDRTQGDDEVSTETDAALEGLDKDAGTDKSDADASADGAFEKETGKPGSKESCAAGAGSAFCAAAAVMAFLRRRGLRPKDYRP